MEAFAGNTIGSEIPPAPTAASRVVLVLSGVQFVDVLGVTVVVTALPRMLADLGAAPAFGGAVVTAYAMFFGGLLMVAARVGDRIGHRRLVLGALTVFAAAALVAGSASSVWPLVAARAVQGAAAAAAVPGALRLLTTVIPDGPARRRAVAGWSAAGAAAGASGFVLGGVLTQLASWRVIYWMNVPVAVLLAAAVVRYVPEVRSRAQPDRIGWPSALLLTGAAMGIVSGTNLLAENMQIRVAAAAIGLGLLAAAGFALLEQRTRHPLVAPAARRSAGLRWGTIAAFTNTATTSSSMTVATLYLQDRRGLTPLATAELLISFSLLVILGSLLAPKIITAAGWRGTLGVGIGMIAAGNIILAAYPHPVTVALAAGTCGLGIGASSVAATDMGTSVDESIKATAAGALNTAAQLGTAIGTALILLIATTLQPRIAWATAAALAAATAVAAYTGHRPDQQESPFHSQTRMRPERLMIVMIKLAAPSHRQYRRGHRCPSARNSGPKRPRAYTLTPPAADIHAASAVVVAIGCRVATRASLAEGGTGRAEPAGRKRPAYGERGASVYLRDAQPARGAM